MPRSRIDFCAYACKSMNEACSASQSADFTYHNTLLIDVVLGHTSKHSVTFQESFGIPNANDHTKFTNHNFHVQRRCRRAVIRPGTIASSQYHFVKHASYNTFSEGHTEAILRTGFGFEEAIAPEPVDGDDDAEADAAPFVEEALMRITHFNRDSERGTSLNHSRRDQNCVKRFCKCIRFNAFRSDALSIIRDVSFQAAVVLTAQYHSLI